MPIDEDPNKVVKIDLNLCEEDRHHLISFLHANADVYAWSAFDMPAKWAIELEEFDIKYLPRPSIKAQVLVDFILECIISDEEQNAEEVAPIIDECWELHVDGSSNTSGSRAGLMQTSPKGVVAEYALHFEFFTSNNEAEYEMLVIKLRMAKDLGVWHLRVHSDSQLIVGQIPRTENVRVGATDLKRSSYIETLEKLSIEEPTIMQTNPEPSWVDLILHYLQDGILPVDRNEVKKLRHRAPNYLVYDRKLYKRSFTLSLLRCLCPSEAEYVL
ncbi:uncharacterized protein [Elaeis guineensis]|uniref:uncharacterized protein n=1 Tax=Elaeis guineensis var. tenera TaxID=51953 RepID=UPI003C6D10F0